MSSRPRAPSWQSIFRILALLSHLVSRTIARTKRVVKPKHGPVPREDWGSAVERRAAQARCRRPDRRAGSRGTIERAIAPETARPGPVDLPRELGEAVQNAESILSRLPSSDEPCWLVAGCELEDPRRASPSLACLPARPRPQAWKPSILASMASAHMPKGTSQRARRDQSGTSRRRESRRSTSAPSARPPGASEPTGAPRQ